MMRNGAPRFMTIEVLLNNAEIIRNRRKIEASINNARRFLEVQKEFGSFDRYIHPCFHAMLFRSWTTTPTWRRLNEKNSPSSAMTEQLMKRGT